MTTDAAGGSAVDQLRRVRLDFSAFSPAHGACLHARTLNRPRPSLRSTVASIALLALGAALSACAVAPPDGDGEGSEGNAEEVQPVRRVLLCQQGLSDRVTEWDKGLFSLCQTVEKTGFELIYDGKYPAFGALDESGAYKALFQTLDTNDDGAVDADDTPTLVHLVGFSWGGVNVTDIAERLRKDKHVAAGRKGVAAMVLLDPFQPQLWSARIPANVARAWEYRQTETTSGDCSSTVSLGFGFNGLTPKAKSESTACTYYDLDAFMTGVGHCDVPMRAKAAAIVNLTQYEDYEPWSDQAADCPVD
jgi:hypothetical protein